MSMPLLVLVIVTLVLFIVFSLFIKIAEYLDARMDMEYDGSYIVADVYAYVGLLMMYIGSLMAIGSPFALAYAISTLVM